MVKLVGYDITSSQQLVSLYEKRVAVSGFSPKTMFYRNPEQHTLKLETVSRSVALIEGVHNKTLLDIGCGYGELIGLIPNIGHYIGIDIVPSFVDEARKRFPGYDFRVSDATSFRAATPDICVLAGVLSGAPAPFELLHAALRLATSAVIFDVTLIGRLPKDYYDLNRFAPGEIVHLIETEGFRLNRVWDRNKSWVLFCASRQCASLSSTA